MEIKKEDENVTKPSEEVKEEKKEEVKEEVKEDKKEEKKEEIKQEVKEEAKDKEIEKNNDKEKDSEKNKENDKDNNKEKVDKKEKEKDKEKVEIKEEKKDEYIFQIVKTEDWDKVIPKIINSIDEKKENNSNFTEYPYFRIQNAVQYLPKLDIQSDILNTNQLKELHSRLPNYHQYSNLYRIFTISKDGSALKTLYDKCEGINNSVIIIKDDEDNIFGAYASEVFTPTSKFSGTGECFLFTFYKGNKIHIYCSTGKNDHYMYCDDEQICFGCSDDFFSLSIRNNLLEGYSKYTQTYENESLNNRDKFIVVRLEVWGFKKNK